MRIAISAGQESLDGPMDSRFGRAPYFFIIDTNTKEQVSLRNVNADASGGAGVQTAQLMADQGIDMVITGHVGPKAKQVLDQAGIKVHTVKGGSVREALKELDADSAALSEPKPIASLTQTLDSPRRFKAAIATDGSEVAAHFGHCPHYTLIHAVDGQIEKQETVPNPGHKPGFLPRYLAELGIDIMIAGGMGMNAQELFAEHSIKTITGVSGRVEDVAKQYIEGRLVPGSNQCDHEL